MAKRAEDGRGEGNAGVESWTVQIQQRYNSGQFSSRETSFCASIYRVPESTRNTNPKAYDPLVVPLGPYHHKKHLSAMDDLKLQAVVRTLERIHGMTMVQLIREVKKLEGYMRDCYEDLAVDWNSESLVWMLTMDGCFVLDYLREGTAGNIKSGEMILDILKLENQIPLCILRKILELEFRNTEYVPVFLAKRLIKYRYFNGFPFSQTSVEEEKVKLIQKLITERSPYHLLDLCREVIADYLTESLTRSDSGSGSQSPSTGACSGIANTHGVTFSTRPRWTHKLRSVFPSIPIYHYMIPSAEKLQSAGIQFRTSPNGNVSFRYESFGRATLSLPQITVDDSTEIFLRNLMALEECLRGSWFPITASISEHVRLMDNLIDSKEDVWLLEEKDIIKHNMGSDEEVATILNVLCIGITHGDPQLGEVLKMVNEHYKNSMNVWMRRLKEEHCSKPCYVVTFVAAVVLLGLTAVQAVFSVLQYKSAP